jgi:hypothetical protein
MYKLKCADFNKTHEGQTGWPFCKNYISNIKNNKRYFGYTTYILNNIHLYIKIKIMVIDSAKKINY